MNNERKNVVKNKTKHKIPNFNFKSKYEKLVEEIPDIEEQIQEDKVKVIRVKQDSKIPLGNDYYNKPSKLKDLQEHKGNYGIIVGYNHKKNNKSLAVIDVDGYSIKEDGVLNHEIKQKTKEYIFNCLKSIPNCLAVRTASGGYHIYLWNETIVDNFHNISKCLTFPSDFEIEKLQGKSLGHSIEIFTKEGSKQVVLPSSSIYSNAMEQNYYYKVISDVKQLSDIATVNNIHETVKETMIAKGFGYNEELLNSSNRKKNRKGTSNNKRKYSTKPKLKKLSDNEIEKVVELITDKYKLFEAIEGAKHEGTLALGGCFTYHITKWSTTKIAVKIVEKIGNIFNDSEAFKKTLLESYERPVEEKAGLPTLLELVESLDSDFKTEDFSEELLAILTNEYEETKLKETFFYDEKEYSIFLLKSKTDEFYLIRDFTKTALNLEYHKAKHFILLRDNEKPIAKLRLKKTVEGIEATDKGLKKFENKLKDKSIILDFEEILEELDLLFTDSKEIKKVEMQLEEEEKDPPLNLQSKADPAHALISDF